MIKLGITGGIGCGKSAVCRLLEQHGIPIIHADLVARELMESDPAIRAQIKQAFGDDVYLPDGRLDRKRLADIIFADEQARQRVNHIVHPQVVEYQKTELEKLAQSGKYRIAGVEAALIFEAGAETQFDVIVVVAASVPTVIRRLMKRDGLPQAEIMKRIAAQMPLSEKIKRADIVIYNDGSLDELNHKVKRLFMWLNNQER
ncbi:MAG: dephospho-CoA kinase [candidate division KSB1 bacterium]|nr:dephospho-CoA kinase [candidate division KSB1 bacterium]MDZ7319845.1 dephospho-CoA kinase [candidate division KSB1 bacterium]MDZ7342634.1 dephospho-CoA kinase [candidate division KSB1 bacterium]